MPGRPKRAQPPPALSKLSKSIRHPDVVQTGLTTTDDGEWALLLRIRAGVKTPIAEIEKTVGGNPVVYQTAPAALPVARPAYPAEGE